MEEKKVSRYESILSGICGGLYDYIKKYQIRTLVLGLSGGLDSTVCAAICNMVVNDFNTTDNGFKIKLIGVGLPCSTNTKEEQDNEARCGSFCDEYVSENIQRLYEAALETCEHANFESTNISKGNIKARLRMLYLYNVASTQKGIVIDTDNLTEHYLGFWTIHGDDGDLNPIGCLWKTEVYELAEYIKSVYQKMYDECVLEPDSAVYEYHYKNKLEMQIQALQHAIDITPTDGNGVKEGGDLAQIAPGYTYFDVDKVLRKYLVEQHYDYFDEEDELIDMISNDYGIDRDTVVGIINRYHNSQYKRLHRPLVITTTGRVVEKHEA